MKGKTTLNNALESMAMKGEANDITPDDLGIVSRIPQAKEGDPETLRDLGMEPSQYKIGPIDLFVRGMEHQFRTKYDDMIMIESGKMPKDWPLYLAWKEEIKAGRIPIPWPISESEEFKAYLMRE